MAVAALLKPFIEAPAGAGPQGDGYFASMEAWKTDDSTAVPNVALNRLDGKDIGDWAWRRGKFRPAAVTSGSSKIEGGIRLLIAEAKEEHRAAIPAELSNADVLDALHLPACTFTSYTIAAGTYSMHTFPNGCTMTDCERFSLVYRTPQRRHCTLGGLSMTYDFSTQTTTALIITHVFALARFPAQQDSPMPAMLEDFASQIKACYSLWAHPFVLVTNYLVRHAHLVHKYVVEQVDLDVHLSENTIGVVRSARSHYQAFGVEDALFENGQFQRQRAARLVAHVNELSTGIIHTQRSPQWDLSAIKVLTDLLDQHERLRDHPAAPVQVFRETLDYLHGNCEATYQVTTSNKARMELQLNILYTSIAQDDGQTSARIAASAGKDSTSMKIIALITAAYLPATFVATLFSTGMFDWHDDGGNEVSRSFWIYWAVSVPLTILTLTGWALWWSREKRQYERTVQRAVQDQDAKVLQKRATYGLLGRGSFDS